ncbi:zinc transporter ZIP8-like [Scleropages formosus]|uniref:zinc transporter ZIP8-like n=1 Tax=Scleropages formosus TaxID=113540 RepID=UPI0008780B6B|nr:zinc transporter ZIP8-like [Scleropages formosus]
MGDQDSSPSPKCVSLAEVLSHYGLSNQCQLSMEHLKNICLTILHQGPPPVCPTQAPPPKTLDHHAWGYGFLAVSIINLSSLMGLALVPFAAKPCFPKVLSYFTALGIGTLFSNAVLQLIPEVLGFDPGADNYNLSVTGIFGGFYVLFFTEGILKMVLKTEHEVRHHPVAKHGHGDERPPLESFSASVRSSAEGVTASSVGSIISISSSVPFDLSTVQDPLLLLPTLLQEGRTRTVCCGWLRSRPLGSVRTVAWMVTLSDALHNFADGLVIGASFVASVLAGFSTSIAVMCEELPHELGDFVILLNAGLSIPQAVFFNILSSLSCYLGLALGILVGGAFAPNAIFGIAGGMFLYVSAVDMFPEMNNIPRCEERTPRSSVLFFLIQNAGLLSGFAVILLITLFAGDISLE